MAKWKQAAPRDELRRKADEEAVAPWARDALKELTQEPRTKSDMEILVQYFDELFCVHDQPQAEPVRPEAVQPAPVEPSPAAPTEEELLNNALEFALRAVKAAAPDGSFTRQDVLRAVESDPVLAGEWRACASIQEKQAFILRHTSDICVALMEDGLLNSGLDYILSSVKLIRPDVSFTRQDVLRAVESDSVLSEGWRACAASEEKQAFLRLRAPDISIALIGRI